MKEPNSNFIHISISIISFIVAVAVSWGVFTEKLNSEIEIRKDAITQLQAHYTSDAKDIKADLREVRVLLNELHVILIQRKDSIPD